MSSTETPKTLVFNFDGTGNEPSDADHFTEDESISNVLKLHILLGGALCGGRSDTTTPGGQPQYNFYYSGIGTDTPGAIEKTDTRDWFPTRIARSVRKSVNMVFAPKWGDARRILADAREDLQRSDYREGDRVLVFGFSRGAALARKFVSQVLSAGECRHIAFLGVFDTVAAFNGIQTKGETLSTDVVFEDGSLDSGVKRAVHLLALDETRDPFRPMQINKDIEQPERILEVWFPGVHSDVGGGYWRDGLSDLAMEFMIAECRKSLGEQVRICPGDHASVQALLDDKSVEGHDLCVDDLFIHPMVHGTLHVHSGFRRRAMQETPRHPCVHINDAVSRNADDLPVLHHSVAERFRQVSGYRPHALRNLKFRLLLANGEIMQEPVCGIGGLLRVDTGGRGLLR